MSRTVIAETVDAPILRGAAAQFWEYGGHESMMAGPYETGKTFATLLKLHTLLSVVPNARALMVRKTYKSTKDSAVVTYEKKILLLPPDHPESPIMKYGGHSPEFYEYPNGARLIVGGMDNPDKFLSAEYDYIYVNQAEELLLDDWEKLTGRATGRAGNTKTPQVFGDCNPGPPTHWIKQRPSLKVFESRHQDNPTLHDGEDWTEQGRRTLAVLDRLTGVRRKRGRDGLWVAAEGQVYEFDPAIHEIDPFPIPEHWRKFCAIDFGYTNPFVCQWWAVDEDGRMYLYREIYMSQRTVGRHSGQIKALSEGETIETCVTDHDAEDNATLNENQIYTTLADKRIKYGIERVEDRLAKAGDGKPRIFFMRDALVEVDAVLRDEHKPAGTVEEFSSYVWPQAASGRTVKEIPVDRDNHGMDAMRYAVMYVDGYVPLLM